MQSAPWLMIFPGLAIFVVVVVFNMLGVPSVISSIQEMSRRNKHAEIR